MSNVILADVALLFLSCLCAYDAFRKSRLLWGVLNVALFVFWCAMLFGDVHKCGV